MNVVHTVSRCHNLTVFLCQCVLVNFFTQLKAIDSAKSRLLIARNFADSGSLYLIECLLCNFLKIPGGHILPGF